MALTVTPTLWQRTTDAVRAWRGLPPRFAPVAARRAVVDDTGFMALDAVTGLPLAAQALASYWVIATNWRAKKIAEAPLMVARESPVTGDDEWLPRHPVAKVLGQPLPDLSMTALVHRTSCTLDATGEALWVVDATRGGIPARLTLVEGGRFETIKPDARRPDADRLYPAFRLSQSREVISALPSAEGRWGVYFQDFAVATDYWTGHSRLAAAGAWLGLSADIMRSVSQIVQRAPKRTALVQPDEKWQPSQADFDAALASLRAQFARGENAIMMTGGGTVSLLSASLADILPETVLNRVESVVAALTGVPAIVLQYEVGLQNSPWSQMAEARRMAYDDTVAPAWKAWAETLTNGLLRPVDADRTHVIRFDASRVAALQQDRAAGTLMAMQAGEDASLNERRAMMGLEPLDDPRAQEVRSLEPRPTFGVALPTAAEDEEDEDIAAARQLNPAQGVNDVYRDLAEAEWLATASLALARDASAIEEIVLGALSEDEASAFVAGDAEGRATSPKRRVLAAVRAYLIGAGRRAWERDATAVASVQSARRGRAMAAEIEVDWNLVRPDLVRYAAKGSRALAKGIGQTTADNITRLVEGGFAEGTTVQTIARAIGQATGVGSPRALLIARTEAGRVTNGAALETVLSAQRRTGTRYVKTWRTALDARVRDEHAAMEGETVDATANFSNGESAPGSPNCRCWAQYSRIGED